MIDSRFQGIPWRRFKEFIDPEADRFTILKELLEEAELEHSILDIAGNRHFITAFRPPGEGFFRRRPLILTAHYDRAKGSEGANDNSAAVFLLLETAMKLKRDSEKNWIIIFTDKEEIKTGESIQNQGSYSLALGFKNLKMENPRIFCFDACGTGDTLVISTTADHLLKKESGREKLLDSMAELRGLALNTARDLRMEKVLLAPTPFSDDAGFLRAGIAAQTITMLPSRECIPLVSELRRNPDFADSLVSAELRQAGRTRAIPETWRCLNTRGDSYLRLTPEHYRAVLRFAEALCKS